MVLSSFSISACPLLKKVKYVRRANQMFVEFAAGAKEVDMKQYMRVIVLVIAMVFGFGVTAYAEDTVGRTDSGPVKPATIKGEVLKIDGNNYLVKDHLSGKDVKFAIETDMKAKLERLPKVGDQIEAQLTPEGYAKAVVFAKLNTMDRGATDKSESKDKSAAKDPKNIGEIQAPGAIEPGKK